MKTKRTRTVAASLLLALGLAGAFAALFVMERRERVRVSARVEQLQAALAASEIRLGQHSAKLPTSDREYEKRIRDKFQHFYRPSPPLRPILLDSPGPGYRAQSQSAELAR